MVAQVALTWAHAARSPLLTVVPAPYGHGAGTNLVRAPPRGKACRLDAASGFAEDCTSVAQATKVRSWICH